MAKCGQVMTEKLCGIGLIDFVDFVEPKPVDTRTGDEIAADIINRAGLTLGGDKT